MTVFKLAQLSDFPLAADIERAPKQLGASIFFLDEAGFESDPPLGRTYGLKGHTPIVVTSGNGKAST